MENEAVREALEAIVGKAQVLTSSTDIKPFSTDWTGQWTSYPQAVVLPKNADEVAAVLALCAQRNISVVPQGGNTGLVGGSVGGDFAHIIVSTKNLRDTSFDSQRNQLTVGAGMTLAGIQHIAQSHGLVYPVDLASRDHATIGGTVATNAGGVRVIAYGMTKKHVVGLRIALSDGSVIDRLHRLDKDNTGIDYVNLALGSEGTIGIVTDVCVQLCPERKAKWTSLIPCESIAQAVEVAQEFANQVVAAEIFESRGAAEVSARFNFPLLETSLPWYLLLEGDGEMPSRLPSAQIALNADDVNRFWKYRELQAAMLNEIEKVVKVDVSVAPQNLATFYDSVVNSLQTSGITTDNLFVFGHILDGNLHVAVTEQSDHENVTSKVIHCALDLDGALSAEHGIGRVKNSYLPLVKSKRELQLMQQIREVFDPAGIMNPHVLKTK